MFACHRGDRTLRDRAFSNRSRKRSGDERLLARTGRGPGEYSSGNSGLFRDAGSRRRRHSRTGRSAPATIERVKSIDFDPVRRAAAGLPDVEVTTSWGAPALKVRGTMFVCQAINKQAEPNTLVVRMDLAQRDALIEEDPDVYYLKDHYVDYPCVLVRLSRVHPDALRDLVQTAHRFVSATTPKPRKITR
jgi:hypothetical protein